MANWSAVISLDLEQLPSIFSVRFTERSCTLCRARGVISGTPSLLDSSEFVDSDFLSVFTGFRLHFISFKEAVEGAAGVMLGRSGIWGEGYAGIVGQVGSGGGGGGGGLKELLRYGRPGSIHTSGGGGGGNSGEQLM